MPLSKLGQNAQCFFKRRLIGSGILRILKEFLACDISSRNIYHSFVYSNDI